MWDCQFLFEFRYWILEIHFLSFEIPLFSEYWFFHCGVQYFVKYSTKILLSLPWLRLSPVLLFYFLIFLIISEICCFLFKMADFIRSLAAGLTCAFLKTSFETSFILSSDLPTSGWIMNILRFLKNLFQTVLAFLTLCLLGSQFTIY